MNIKKPDLEKFDKEYVKEVQTHDVATQSTIKHYQIIVFLLKAIEKVGYVLVMYKFIDAVVKIYQSLPSITLMEVLL